MPQPTIGANLAFAVLLLASPVAADVQFHAKPMTNSKLPRGKAQCEIRLLVDQQVEVSLRGDTVSVHTLTGADARDNGSECSEPLPSHVVDGFTLTVKKKQGEVRLVEAPTERNGYKATIFIHDNAPGEGVYDLRINWITAALPAGINSNNAIHSAGRGSGTAALNDSAPVTLGNATVDLDRAGNAVVTFQIGRSGSAAFTGTVISWEGGVLKLDARADERFHKLPGPMYVYFDASKQVYKVSLDATNGQEQLRVSWQRK